MATKTKKKPDEKTEQLSAVHRLAGNDALIVVGYETENMSDIQNFLPQFSPDKRLSDPLKIQENLKQKQAYFEFHAKNTPYYGRLKRVVLVDCQPTYSDPPVQEFVAEEGKPSPAVRASEWLQEKFGERLETRLDGRWDEGKIHFVGFEPKRFLRLLGVECALCGSPCPTNLWYGNSDHRDILSLLLPEDLAKQTDEVSLPLRMLGIKMETMPGADAFADAAITVQVLQKFGFTK